MVTGRFYGESGQPTEALLEAEASLAEGQRIKAQSEAERLRFPPCNSQWSAAEGGRVWCTTKRFGHGSGRIKREAHEVVLTCNGFTGLTSFLSSGGVERAWAGVPRKLFSPGSTGVHCVCVEDPAAADGDPNLQTYGGCPQNADSCSVEK